MENYQEKILGNILNSMGNNWQYSNYEILSTIKDCFTISRLQQEIASLSRSAAFNKEPSDRMIEKQDELDLILVKYKNALK